MSFPFVQPYFGLGNSLQTAQASGGGGGGSPAGGWVELARTTLGSANTDMLVSSLPDKRYYMILGHGQGYGSAVSNFRHRFNGDTGTNYASRQNQNGGSDSTYTGLNGIQQDKATNGDSGAIIVGYVANKSDKEKLMIMHTGEFGGTGAGTAPVNRKEIVGKWANTSDPISSYTWTQYQGTDQFQSGNEVVVLGWDPTDTHTSNFWEELDSFTQTSASPSIDLTLTGKKYLWIQFFAKATTVTGVEMQFNSDTGSNYAERNSNDGAADATGVSKTKLERFSNAIGSGETCYGNTFIVNNASNEKLCITHSVDTGTGSGAANAAGRREVVGKWANTSAQITALKFFVGNGNLDVGSTIKVWGSN